MKSVPSQRVLAIFLMVNAQNSFRQQSTGLTPLLNPDKIEILFIGPKNSSQNLLDHNLKLDGCTVTSSTVKNLGVILDSNLSFENHISHVTKTAFFHLRNIPKLRNMLSVSDASSCIHDL